MILENFSSGFQILKIDISVINDGEVTIEIPKDLLINDTKDLQVLIVSIIYPSLLHNLRSRLVRRKLHRKF